MNPTKRITSKTTNAKKTRKPSNQMLSPFSCGFFHPEDVRDEQPINNISSPCSTPRRSSRSRTTKDTKNPYSTRGLDKFSALLADLEEKRQKIYAQTPPQDISFVRFVFKDSDDDSAPVPIVIKLKGKKEDMNNKTMKQADHQHHQQVVVKESRHVTGLDKFTNEPSTPTKDQQQHHRNRSDKKRVFLSWSFKGMWRRPSYYLPVVVVIILVLLAVFGRSVAILCTSIGWYALPTLKESSNNKRSRTSRQKDHVMRRLSENNKMANNDHHHGLSSPKSSNSATGTPRSQHHGHQKSW